MQKSNPGNVSLWLIFVCLLAFIYFPQDNAFKGHPRCSTCQNCTFQTYLPLDPIRTIAVLARLSCCHPKCRPHICLWSIAHPIPSFWNVLPLFSLTQAMLMLGAQLNPNCLQGAFLNKTFIPRGGFLSPGGVSQHLQSASSKLGSPLCVHPASQAFFLFFFFLLFSTAPRLYEGSETRGWIRGTPAGLHDSYSNAGSELLLQSTPLLTATLDP